MNPVFNKILLMSLISVSTMMAGGIIAIYFKPSSALRSAILHFAAGVVFSVVAVEILPDVIKIHNPVQICIGFSFGILLMLALRYFLEGRKKEHNAGNQISLAFLIAIGVDIFIDGLLLGMGFSVGEKEGYMLAIALATEFVSLGLGTSTSLIESKESKQKVLGILFVFALVFFGSAVLGGTLLSNLPESAMEIVLSFGLSALLFLVTEELLVEDHKEKESPILAGAFFLGFLLLLILSMSNP